MWEEPQALCLGLLGFGVLRRGWWSEKGGGLTLLGVGHGGVWTAAAVGRGRCAVVLYSGLCLGFAITIFGVSRLELRFDRCLRLVTCEIHSSHVIRSVSCIAYVLRLDLSRHCHTKV